MKHLNNFFKYGSLLQTAFFLFLFFIYPITFYSQQRPQKKDSLIKLIKKKENADYFSTKDTTYINLLNELALEYTFSTSDSLYILSNSILDYSTKAGYAKGIGQAYLGLTSYFLEKGNDSLVFSHLEKAKRIGIQTKDTILLLDVSNLSAIEYNHIGHSDKSLKEYLKSEKLASKIANKLYLLTIYENMAVTYSHKKMYQRALKYFGKANELAVKINDSILIGSTLCNMTKVHISLNDLELATKESDQSIKIFEKYKVNGWLGYAYMLKGDIFLNQKKYDEAIVWYNKSEPIQLSTNYDIGVMDLYNSISKVYIQKNDLALGKMFAIKASNLANEIRYPRGIATSAENLSLIYEKLKEPVNSLKYHKLFKKMSDSLSKNEQLISMAFLDIERTHQNEQYELINQNNTKLYKQKQLLYVSLASLLSLSAIAFLIRKNLNTQKDMSTALKIKNEILAANENKLKTINSTKDKLFSIIGHDLRSPILSLKELLNLSLEEDTIFKRFIPKLKTQVEHIQFTLDNLLSWGQTQMKGATTNIEEVRLREISQNNRNLFSKSIENKKIEFQLLIEENTSVLADTNHIDLILRNLISNAIKFTPEKGKIIITATIKDDIVVCSVKDNGLGIKKENIDKLFNETTHYSTYGTFNEKGTGLGLSLCQEMVKLNNGSIWVISEENSGSTFSFSFPKFKKKQSS
ncbi:tetratricopeptide repeat-containing sensor histidine kinase [Maribacter sp.]|uniref:tetratricopeptide repeat-containing sensor histidine kinase n=1 Tax=Maribacter sp. TaxID=1897614 RepID=UPI0025BFCF43|nr:tetratricopeptide repeat-containing sensor histidine kinase [Maribacter sp.]